MNSRLVIRLLGRVLIIEGACMLLPALVALCYGESDVRIFLTSAAITGAAGLAAGFVRADVDALRAREGFLVVGLSWLMLSVFGALPFYLGGHLGALDSLFESASSFNTTGASVIGNVEALPQSLIFWCALSQWIGGMGVLMLTLALIPNMGAGSLHLLRAESTGPTPGKLVPRIAGTTRILYMIYLVLTAAEFLVLMLCGMGWFDAAVHAFGTAATGGFSNSALSVARYNSPLIEMVIATFLILFGVNFSLYYFAAIGNTKGLLRNEELRVYLILVGASALAIAANTLSIYPSLGDALRHGYFHVASFITSAGYATTDYHLWPMFSRMLLLMLMVVGGCAGSTSGGLKIVRVMLLTKSARRELSRTIHPRAVSAVKLNGKPVDESLIAQAQSFFFLYIALSGAVMVIVSLDGFGFETTFTAVISAISNIGRGFGDIGMSGNYSIFSPLSKIALMFTMIAGRLELYPVLMLATAKAWKRGG